MEQVTLPSAREAAVAKPPPLPSPAPLEMPEQSLDASDPARRRSLRGESSVYLARAGLAATTILLSAVLIHQMYLVLAVGGLTSVEWAMLGLFVINIAWIALGALTPLMGFFLAPAGPAETPVPLSPRTPLLMPTYNE
jgi:membrane glycosyltransferase